jgi:hypothetical protein
MAVVNHISVKSKWKTWHQGIECGEEASGCLGPRYQSFHIEPQNSKC